MDGGGTRMGSRSSTRHGPAAVFNGPVRRWRKSWSPLPATTVPLTSTRLQLYRWTPQGTREDTAEEAAARPVKFMPLFVVMERRKEALRRAAEAAARLKKQEQGGAVEGLESQEGERVSGSEQDVPEGDWIGKDSESDQQAVNFGKVDGKKLPEEHQNLTQEADVEMLSEDSEGSDN